VRYAQKKIHFDQEVANCAANHNALYRRYSDDLILSIPTKSAEVTATNYRGK